MINRERQRREMAHVEQVRHEERRRQVRPGQWVLGIPAHWWTMVLTNALGMMELIYRRVGRRRELVNRTERSRSLATSPRHMKARPTRQRCLWLGRTFRQTTFTDTHGVPGSLANRQCLRFGACLDDRFREQTGPPAACVHRPYPLPLSNFHRTTPKDIFLHQFVQFKYGKYCRYKDDKKHFYHCQRDFVSEPHKGERQHHAQQVHAEVGDDLHVPALRGVWLPQRVQPIPVVQHQYQAKHQNDRVAMYTCTAWSCCRPDSTRGLRNRTTSTGTTFRSYQSGP